MNGAKVLAQFKKHSSWSKVESILKTLQANGYVAWLAGGCVRDALMGRQLQDFDVVTDATPDQVETLFERTVSVGKQFGVIRVLIAHESFEVATFRKDVGHSDGRRPDRIASATAQEDAERRDFTINGIFFDPGSAQIIDFVNGLSDLQHNILRAIGTPSQRFAEDKLRMLRAVRFISQLGVKMSRETWDSLRIHAAELHVVSAERITDELHKIFKSPNPCQSLKMLAESGMLQVIFPDIERKIWDKTISSLGRQIKNNPQISWKLSEFLAFLLSVDAATKSKRGVDVMTSKFGTWKLRLSGEEIKFLNANPPKVIQLSRQKVWHRSELLPILAGGFGAATLKIFQAFCLVEGITPKAFKWYWEQRNTLKGRNCELPKPWVSGKDLVKLGFSKGPQMGQALHELYAGQMDGRWKSPTQARSWIRAKISVKS